jgi:hypothetical protein
MRALFVQHPCDIEAKTVSLKLASVDHRFCFDIARTLLRAIVDLSPQTLIALMVQRRVGRITSRLSDPDQHKVHLPGTCGGSLSFSR